MSEARLYERFFPGSKLNGEATGEYKSPQSRKVKLKTEPDLSTRVLMHPSLLIKPKKEKALVPSESELSAGTELTTDEDTTGDPIPVKHANSVQNRIKIGVLAAANKRRGPSRLTPKSQRQSPECCSATSSPEQARIDWNHRPLPCLRNRYWTPNWTHVLA